MRKQFMNILRNSLLSIALSFVALSPVLAEKVDISQQINISATRQAADLKNKIFSYIDDVVITQGSLIIHADLVQIISQLDSDEKIYIAIGKPATFEQTLEDGKPINLQAAEIRYEPHNSIVIISGNAILRQEDSEVSGSKITYNFDTEYVSAESNENQQVQTIFQPKAKTADQDNN